MRGDRVVHDEDGVLEIVVGVHRHVETSRQHRPGPSPHGPDIGVLRVPPVLEEYQILVVHHRRRRGAPSSVPRIRTGERGIAVRPHGFVRTRRQFFSRRRPVQRRQRIVGETLERRMHRVGQGGQLGVPLHRPLFVLLVVDHDRHLPRVIAHARQDVRIREPRDASGDHVVLPVGGYQPHDEFLNVLRARFHVPHVSRNAQARHSRIYVHAVADDPIGIRILDRVQVWLRLGRDPPSFRRGSLSSSFDSSVVGRSFHTFDPKVISVVGILLFFIFKRKYKWCILHTVRNLRSPMKRMRSKSDPKIFQFRQLLTFLDWEENRRPLRLWGRLQKSLANSLHRLQRIRPTPCNRYPIESDSLNS